MPLLTLGSLWPQLLSAAGEIVSPAEWTLIVSVAMWLVLTMFGLLPLWLAWIKSVFNGISFGGKQFFNDGSLLFFGPAVLCATVGELILKQAYVHSGLHFVYIILLTVITVIVASLVYGDLYAKTEEQHRMQLEGSRGNVSLTPPTANAHYDTLIRELSLRLTICALTLSISITAVFNYKHLHIENHNVPAKEANAPDTREPAPRNGESG